MHRTRHLAASLPFLALIAAPHAAAEFDACLDRLAAEANAAGVSQSTISSTTASVNQNARVLELDRQQPEFLQTFGRYLETRLTSQRVRRGRELLEEHAELLHSVQRDFGIPAQYLVAFWGLETNFGGYFGDFPVLDALATLACDTRRSEFFSAQFVEALALIDRDQMRPEQMRGSWAGAMGHTQFLPETARRHGIDYDGDGRIDLWNSLPDAMASAANYLRAMGWNEGERWGREVRLPDDFPLQESGIDTRKPLRDWAALGVRRADGGPLPEADIQAALLLPSGYRGPAFLVYPNFRIIMRWNPSTAYALSVGLLADQIAGGEGLLRQPPDEQPLSRDEVRELQGRLNALGHDSGQPDGIAGRMTRNAVRAYQRQAELPTDGHPNRALLDRMRRQARDG
ncbi:lytic murein transglycosylase [Methylonatrum kenyense]|uniref:lytic murein transglycosylase n=1 Tax=Methylonatrum kenyense TaxID=455253 RepID=UPI0020BE83E4|nr:lytic murein transglycosylase [Methylonatrum kenyense]MCK8515588.1 lytic murein transglycosylase [Methylonatrum kenyense]